LILQIFSTAYKRIDIADFFFEVGLNLIKNNGKLGFIAGTQFLFTEYGRKLRSKILNQRIIEIIDLGDQPIFPDALTYTGIFLLERNKSKPFDYVKLDKIPFKSLEEHLSNRKFKPTLIDPVKLSDDSWSIRSESFELLGKLTSDLSEKLVDKAKAVYGILTGSDSIMVIDKLVGPVIENEITIPIVWPKHIDRWTLYDTTLRVIYPYRKVEGKSLLIEESELKKNYPKCYEYLLSNKSRLLERMDSRKNMDETANKWFGLMRFSSFNVIESPKILTPGVSKNNKFCIDMGNNAFIGKGVSGIIPTNINIYYLSSILNSGYYTYSSTFLKEIPIRRISFTTPADRRAALVDEAKALYTQYLNTPAEPAPLLDFVGERLGAEPEESDVVHDLLAHLAERMIEMNKEKNAEIKAFLGFLEGETGAAVDDMVNKTAVREYYNHEFRKLIDILGKNRKKLRDGYDPKNPTNYRHLQEWYEDSTDKLQPHMGRIEATDRLIDQIVYRLYGLSDEEIKIVEESISGVKNE